MTEEDNQKPWKLLRSEAGEELPIFNVRYDWMENPRNGATLKAVVLDVPDWVTISAVTPDERIVVVRQYRFGVAGFTAELPAGLVNPGEPHRDAAVRELREETGYTSDDWVYLGWVQPNPAYQNNRLHQWLARDARLTSPQELDDGEDVEVSVLTTDQVRREVAEGRFRNSLALLSLSRIMNLWNGDPAHSGLLSDFVALDEASI
ncbi:MAG: NUDIX hydrolase [Syntrophotaleaceae bacterium]